MYTGQIYNKKPVFFSPKTSVVCVVLSHVVLLINTRLVNLRRPWAILELQKLAKSPPTLSAKGQKQLFHSGPPSCTGPPPVAMQIKTL